MSSGLGLFMGVCSGHGLGSGSVHHPGLGGGMLSCPHAVTDPQINPKPVAQMNAVTTWPPLAQTPLTPIKRTVIVNKQTPMVDQDILIPHPTPTQHGTLSVGTNCFTAHMTPAWWCTVGAKGGRETAEGHSRKIMATATTVFIEGKRVSKFGDLMGDGSPQFPCTSTVTGCSPNVFVEMSKGG